MSMPISPTQFGMHPNYPECAIGLVVTNKKNVNFLLVTTASPVCTLYIIALLRMHGHTPGTSPALLITKKIGFVANQNFSQVTI